MLTHYLTRRRIGAYLDGALGEPEARTTAAHLAGCQRCQQESDRLRRLHGLLQETVSTPAPPNWADFWPGVVRGIDEARRTETVPRAAARSRFGWRPRLAVGGAVVAVLASLMLWQTLGTFPDPEGLVVVKSARTELPDVSLMVYASPEQDLAVVWLFSDP